MLADIRWTETEQKIYDKLKDGLPYSIREMVEYLDPLMERSALQMRISDMRKKLNPLMFDIVCVFRNKRTLYQLVRLVRNEE